jgi:hypothetical protein
MNKHQVPIVLKNRRGMVGMLVEELPVVHPSATFGPLDADRGILLPEEWD